MATKRRWSQFLRARRLAIADALRCIHWLDPGYMRLVEEIVLNDEFEATIDRRGRRTEGFMERTYKAWIDGHRETP